MPFAANILYYSQPTKAKQQLQNIYRVSYTEKPMEIKTTLSIDLCKHRENLVGYHRNRNVVYDKIIYLNKYLRGHEARKAEIGIMYLK